MRKLVLLSLILLVSVTWAVAQQDNSSQSAPAGSSAQSSPSSSSSTSAPPSGQASSQSSAGSSQGALAPGEKQVTGCLGGSDPNFTVTDQSGKSYKLQIPAGADTSRLASHVGESVEVSGKVADSSAASSSDMSGAGAKPGSSASTGAAADGKGTLGGNDKGAAGAGSTASSGGQVIQVSRINKGTGTGCSGSKSANPTSK